MNTSAAKCDRTTEPAGMPLPKIVGGDLELGNFVVGMSRAGGTGYEASHLLLREIAGVRADGGLTPFVMHDRASPAGQFGSAAEYGPQSTSQDSGRKYLANGGCAYIDLWHLEVCLPEVRSAREHVAYTHALYRLARSAAKAVNQNLSDGQRVAVLANNSDGRGNSYGSHLNVLVNRQTWEKICHRRLLHQGVLAAYQASSIVFTGLGKVGAENDAPPAKYQISQRADFIERLCSMDTTVLRPIINTRNEPLCGGGAHAPTDSTVTANMARMHVITYDHNLSHVAGFLKIGVLQIILAMLEADWLNAGLMLEDPIHAMTCWSHDPMLQARVRLWAGTTISAVELQLRFFHEAQRFVATGACADRVPEVDTILHLWGDTLEKLQVRNFPALSRRLDWVLKLALFSQALRNRPELNWNSPALRHLDLLYSSLDPADGLYWPNEQRGLVETLVSEEQIERATREAPTDTRAWTRAHLLKLAPPGDVEQIDWDFMKFSLADPCRPGLRRRFQVDLPNPLLGKAETAPELGSASNLAEAMHAIDAKELPAIHPFAPWQGTYGGQPWGYQASFVPAPNAGPSGPIHSPASPHSHKNDVSL